MEKTTPKLKNVFWNEIKKIKDIWGHLKSMGQGNQGVNQGVRLLDNEELKGSEPFLN